MEQLLPAIVGVLGGAVVACIIVVWHLSTRIRATPDVGALEQHVNAVRTEVADLVDKYETVARRASTARAREAKAERAEQPEAVPSDKQELRRMVGRIQLANRGGR